jgi:hypothetical protein
MTPLKVRTEEKCDATGRRDILLAEEVTHKGWKKTGEKPTRAGGNVIFSDLERNHPDSGNKRNN